MEVIVPFSMMHSAGGTVETLHFIKGDRVQVKEERREQGQKVRHYLAVHPDNDEVRTVLCRVAGRFK